MTLMSNLIFAIIKMQTPVHTLNQLDQKMSERDLMVFFFFFFLNSLFILLFSLQNIFFMMSIEDYKI